MAGEKSQAVLNSGARWHRWDPHIHAPGTVLNDQFKSDWEQYLSRIETADPPIRALGVTDYYSTDQYERICQEKANGRLPNVGLIFPNVEMRLNIGTVKGKQVNIHLLVSPEDPNHIAELNRVLGRLTFSGFDDTFNCNKEDLIRLGIKADPFKPATAQRIGSEQFKVSLDQLRTVLNESAWASENILVAVAGSGTDGSGGVNSAADTTMREEIEKLAHVIFASSPPQREFWLGQKTATREHLEKRYGGLKPCLHGCDAHDLDAVASPTGDRFSWVKGTLEFDALRQACIDPAGRAFVGPAAPIGAAPSQVISSIRLEKTPWATTSELALNPGLVAIIGARGSGKTALADMIAVGCDAISHPFSDASFLKRADEYLIGASISLRWGGGDEMTRTLDGFDLDAGEYPKARYLSQQFVEELCSAHGMTDKLLNEIERVIFESHPSSETDGAVDFAEFLDMKAMRFREARDREEEALADLSESIGVELEKQTQIPTLKKQIEEKTKIVNGYTKDRDKLVVKGNDAHVARLTALATAAEKAQQNVRFFNTQEQTLLSLKDEVANHRTHQARETLRQAQEKYKASRLKDDEWESFLLEYAGDVDSSLEIYLAKAKAGAKSWKGVPPPQNIDPQVAYIIAEDDINRLPLAVLEAEIARLEKLVSADKATALRFASFSRNIKTENTNIERAQEKLTEAEGAKAKAKALSEDREAAYARVFEAISSEQAILEALYAPLMDRLKASSGTLSKLSFTVSRKVDVATWAAEGEQLIDLRHKSALKGKGTLLSLVGGELQGAWQKGNSASVTAAMSRLRTKIQDDILEQAPKEDQATHRAWAKRFAKWLYSTEHISIEYSIDYNGVDIRKLSPGTRGIVLLLLYLALDTGDDRPLIIDQPEENLDPQSIFDELVGLFLEAKTKRQVIIVTHNANLVVNTDADQIIIASVGPGKAGELPPITYVSGGLENKAIRDSVCGILEGGERAFKERARRLRVRLRR